MHLYRLISHCICAGQSRVLLLILQLQCIVDTFGDTLYLMLTTVSNSVNA